MAASKADSEVTSTVKSASDNNEDDDEILRISYKDVPDDFFDSLVVDEWTDENKKDKPSAGAAGKPKSTASSSKDDDRESDLRVRLEEKKMGERDGKTTPERRKSDDRRKQSNGDKKDTASSANGRRSRSPDKRKAVSPNRRVSPKRRRSNSPGRRPSPGRFNRRRSPRRSPERRRSPLPKRKRSISPRAGRAGSPRRSISPRRNPRSISPRRNPPVRRRSPSPRRSPVRRRSASRSPKRRRSPSPDLFTARMSSRRTRQRRSTSPRRNSREPTSLSPEAPHRVNHPMKTLVPRNPPRRRSRSPPRKFSRTPPPNPFMAPGLQSGLVQPSLQEIASGAAVPYPMPYAAPYGPPGQMMYNYPQNSYQPVLPYPASHQPQPYPGMINPPIPGIGEVASLSTAYPLPQPVPKPLLEKVVVKPTKAAMKAAVNPTEMKKAPPAPSINSSTRSRDSIPSTSSLYEVEEPTTKSSMKLSDYLASMTAASNKPMEYKKHVDDRIKAAIAKFDATFLQPLRFQVAPKTVDVTIKEENVYESPNRSPLLKNPTIKLGNFIRPLNLRALKVPERPQFICRKPELAPPKPEISIKALLAKKPVSKRDMGTSPNRIWTSSSECQTDPIPDPPPPICLTCVERSKKTYMNHWTQVKRTELSDAVAQTEEIPVPRLGPPVDVYEDLRHSLRGGRASPWEYENPRESPLLMMEPRRRSRSPLDIRSRSPLDIRSRSPVGNRSRSPLGIRPNLSPRRFDSPLVYSPERYSTPPDDRYHRRSPSPGLPPQRFMEDYSPPPPPQRGRRLIHCEECDITLNSEIQLQDHLRSDRHQLRLETLELERRAPNYDRPHHERRGPSRPAGPSRGAGVWQKKPY